MWFATKILPVVSVYTDVSLVVLVAERAPNSLEMEHIKIGIFVHLLKNINRKLILVVSKSAHVPILAIINFFWISLAKFGFVFFRMVEIFNSIVAHYAFVTVLAITLVIQGIWTKFRNVL